MTSRLKNVEGVFRMHCKQLVFMSWPSWFPMESAPLGLCHDILVRDLNQALEGAVSRSRRNSELNVHCMASIKCIYAYVMMYIYIYIYIHICLNMINQVENSAMWMEFRLHPEFRFSSWISWQNGLNHWDNFVNGSSKFCDLRTLPTIPIERSYQIAARKLPSGYKVFVACNPLGFFRSRASSIPWKPYNIWDLMKDVPWSATNIGLLILSVNIIWFSINKLISNQIGLQTKTRFAGFHRDLRLTSMHHHPPYSFHYRQLLQL